MKKLWRQWFYRTPDFIFSTSRSRDPYWVTNIKWDSSRLHVLNVFRFLVSLFRVLSGTSTSPSWRTSTTSIQKFLFVLCRSSLLPLPTPEKGYFIDVNLSNTSNILYTPRSSDPRAFDPLLPMEWERPFILCPPTTRSDSPLPSGKTETGSSPPRTKTLRTSTIWDRPQKEILLRIHYIVMFVL